MSPKRVLKHKKLKLGNNARNKRSISVSKKATLVNKRKVIQPHMRIANSVNSRNFATNQVHTII
jgi:hypothetical protein